MALHILCVIIIFIALAIICDDFFVPSLEAISEKLDLSEDVAGATFMAAGSSAPELFTSVAGVTADSDVGVGTIVGSAVFNLLVIIALTAALTTQTLQLDWRPLIRDSICYALSIAVFVLFAWDAKFEFYESVILLSLYFMYILLMKYNSNLMEYLEGWGNKVGRVSPEVVDIPTTVETVIEINEKEQTNEPPEDNHNKDATPPQGRLPPLQPLKVGFEGTKSTHSIGSAGHGTLPHFSHSHKGEIARSFIRPRSARRLDIVAQVEKVTTNSEPLIPSLFENNLLDDEKMRRKSSVGGHSAYPQEMVKVKSIAAGHIHREMRRLSAQHEKIHHDDSKENDGDVGESSAHGEEEADSKMRIVPCLPAVNANFPEKGEGGGCLAGIRYIVDWILFIVSFPFLCMFTWTIPSCSEAHNRKYFLVSFLASIVWIAILSFGMVTLVGRVGCILNIDKFTMGLVVVAIGTSIPDALSSIIVARDGFGDMAVSNAIGSNVFDIDLGIGLPFVIKSLIDDLGPIRLLSDADQKLYDNDEMTLVPHVKFGFILLIVLLICLGVFGAVKFRLSRTVGISFFLMYILFVSYAYIQDLLCDHDC
ncbi:sodium/potassium/calcium exchanger 1-like isoform X2 [Dendronephthya gigantea]|nr:sodium/potassium/calcium exchanger 1-like isoform X2 [Dendronephthya gigantea]